MAVEAARGCGYRKAGGLYLRAEFQGEPCERLPVPILPCSVCDGCIKFSRSYQWVKTEYILSGAKSCENLSTCGSCPVCRPDALAWFAEPKDRVGLLWIGKQYYESPADWLKESRELGVSRRIAAIPKGFVIGKTWVFVAHPDAIMKKCPSGCNSGGTSNGKCRTCDGQGLIGTPGIFQVFRPQRIELVVTPSMKNEAWVDELVERGVTLFEVPEDDPDHRPVKRAKKTRAQAAADRLAIAPVKRKDHPAQTKIF